MIFISRTQNAFQVPFDNTHSDAISAGISAVNVFDAILEAKSDSLQNDRYSVFCYYNGNANVNRRLEFWSGIASDTAPLILPEASRIVAYSFGATAAATGTIVVRNITTSTIILSVTFSAQTAVTSVGVTMPLQAAGSRLEVYVSAGSFNRPYGVLWFNTAT